MKQRVDMRIDVELLDQVDEARGETTRTAFTERALRRALDGTNVDHALERTKLYPEPDAEITVTREPSESRTSPSETYDANELQRRIRAKMARGRTSKLAEIEAREELGL